MAKKRRRYRPEYKAEIVKLVNAGQSVADVCKEHGLSTSSVFQWVKQAKIDATGGGSGPLTSDERAEFQRLKRENKELKRERDFFEKATAYFAKAKP